MSGMDLEAIRAVVREKSAIHPELLAPLTLRGLRRILEREDVEFIVRPLPRPAQLIPFLGGWSIVVDSRRPERQHVYLGAHELGHLWLHHDVHFDRWETRVYNMGDAWEPDPKEDDAELFATLVLQGPEPWGWNPLDPPTAVATVAPPKRPVRRHAPRPLPTAQQLTFEGRVEPPRRRRRRLERIEEDDKGHIYFVDIARMSWRVLDVVDVISEEERSPGDSGAIARIFYPADVGIRRRVFYFRTESDHRIVFANIVRQWREADSL